MRSYTKNLQNMDLQRVLLLVSTYVVFCLKVCVSSVVSIMQNNTILEDVSRLDVAD
jgi:hypothetical protein